MNRKSALIRLVIAGVVIISILVITKSITPLCGGVFLTIAIIARGIRGYDFGKEKEE